MNSRSIGPRLRDLGLRLYERILTLTGPRAAYALLHAVCLYYLAFDRGAVARTMTYVRRRFAGTGPIGRAAAAYRVFLAFGRALIDRAWVHGGGGRFDIEFRGRERLDALLEGSTRGFVLLSAHVGNWQLALSVLESPGRPVHILMRPDESEAAREIFALGESKAGVRVVSTESFMQGALECAQALEQGDLVAIMGDRPYGAGVAEVKLFGVRAWLPEGAFRIAAAVGCPVAVLLTARTANGGCLIDIADVIKPVYGPRADRRQDIRGWAGAYARALEKYAEENPYQWFVFHDLWAEPADKWTGPPGPEPLEP